MGLSLQPEMQIQLRNWNVLLSVLYWKADGSYDYRSLWRFHRQDQADQIRLDPHPILLHCYRQREGLRPPGHSNISGWVCGLLEKQFVIHLYPGDSSSGKEEHCWNHYASE